MVYGIDTLKMQEIRSCYDMVIKNTNTPRYMKGVINLRGIIVPLIDMRIKLRLPLVEYNKLTVVIVLNVCGRVIGIEVD